MAREYPIQRAIPIQETLRKDLGLVPFIPMSVIDTIQPVLLTQLVPLEVRLPDVLQIYIEPESLVAAIDFYAASNNFIGNTEADYTLLANRTGTNSLSPTTFASAYDPNAIYRINILIQASVDYDYEWFGTQFDRFIITGSSGGAAWSQGTGIRIATAQGTRTEFRTTLPQTVFNSLKQEDGTTLSLEWTGCRYIGGSAVKRIMGRVEWHRVT